MTPALTLDRVSCTFETPGKPPYVALAETTLHIAPGEFVSVVGPTGCGKSTLLNIAAGLMAPTTGQVTVRNQPIRGVNRHAGYLFQAESLMPWRSALSNVCAGLEYRGVKRAEAEARAQDWLRRVGLVDHGHRFPHQLSGGMRKRVALAQTLILDPLIILMDEPFSALDVQTRLLMENELLALWAPEPSAGVVQPEGKSVLFITHDLEEAISLSDRVLILSSGPATTIVGEFRIDLPRPRDVSEIRMQPGFLELHRQIWDAMKHEVLKAYARQLH
jgi:NitT/TauT family transport system ATP-binding protein